MRRVFLLLLVGLALAGCGGDDEPSNAAPATSTGRFPVTIEHALGTTVIPQEPKRVVTIGQTDHETLLAVGIKPVGAMDLFGERPYGKWPWVARLWGGDKPAIVGGSGKGLDIERIASLRPDLILGLYLGADQLSRATYGKLSKIAPTVGPSAGHDDYTTPWRDMARVAGRAVGRLDRVNELIAGIDRRFAAARREHPEFANQTAVVVDASKAPAQYFPYASGDPRGQFMAALGFRGSATIDKEAGTRFFVELSPERIRMLDVDRLVLMADPKPAKRLEADRLFRGLDVVRDGRAVFLPYFTDPPIGPALVFNTVLSIPYSIEHVVPRLESSSRRASPR